MRPSSMRAIAGPSRVVARPTAALARAGPVALARRPLTPSPASSSSSSSSSSVASARTFFSLPDISKLAGLVPGAPDASQLASDGEETRFHASKILPYSPAQMYELISDVPKYAGYIPFCTESTVLDNRGYPVVNWKVPHREPFAVDAELAVGFGGLEERYISKVVGTPFERVSATASKSSPLFKSLVTTWSFTPTTTLQPGMAPGSAGPTMLAIDLAFAFANPLHRIASQAVLPKVADKMVEAFETRAHEVYGGRT